MSVDDHIREFARRVSSRATAMRISQNELCRLVGVSTTYFVPYKNGTAKKLPSADRMEAIAAVLKISVADLISTTPSPTFELTPAPDANDYINSQATRLMNEMLRVAQRRVSEHMHPSLDVVMNWLSLTGRQIHQDNPLCQWMDLYEVPDATDRLLKPVALGPKSMASQKVVDVAKPNLSELERREAGPVFLRQMMETMDPQEIGKIVLSHRQSSDQSCQIDTVELSVDVENIGVHLRTKYHRLLTKVQVASGQKYSLCFTTPAETYE